VAPWDGERFTCGEERVSVEIVVSAEDEGGDAVSEGEGGDCVGGVEVMDHVFCGSRRVR